MAKQKKTPRPTAETPKGFRDYFGADVTERAEMLGKIAGVYHRYGFDALETSAVETVEALGSFLPDVDRPNDGVFAWQEADDETWLALRYDMTAPLARVYAQHRNDLPTPYRRYTFGPVWRNEKPGPGRFRQFYQIDADTVGTASMAADAEICAMLADALEEVGIARGDYVIRINNRKVLNGVLKRVFDDQDFIAETALKPEFDLNETKAALLRTIDKFDKVGEAGVRELLGKGRLDSSGAYIDGVGLADHQIDVVIDFLTARSVIRDLPEQSVGAAQTAKKGVGYAAKIVEHWAGIDPSNFDAGMELNVIILNRLADLVGDTIVGNQGVQELADIVNLLAAQGYGPDRIVIDPSVVRGLGYYTGPVYEAELTFEIKDEKGRPRQFGSVAGGGRYDDLVKRFTGQSVPATGISIGVDRLLAALRMRNQAQRHADGPVVVTVMDRDRMADYQAMVAELRGAGIRAEVYLGNPKNFGNQLKYADRRGAPIAIIEGGDEKAQGVVQIKDLLLGAKIAETASLEEWKDRPSQIEVSRDRLVAEVKRILRDQQRDAHEDHLHGPGCGCF